MSENQESLTTLDGHDSDINDDLVRVPPKVLDDSLERPDPASREEKCLHDDRDGLKKQDQTSTKKSVEFGASLSKNINRIQALLRTSTGQDAVLASIEYLAHAMHYLSRSKNSITNHLISKCRSGTRGTDNTHTSPKEPPQQHLLELSSLFANTRCTVRLLGLLNICADVPEVLRSPPEDRAIFGIGVLQVLALTTYQLLENIGHLASNDVLSPRLVGPKSKIPRFYIWGARALVVHFVLDFLKLSKEAWLARKSTQAGKTADGRDTMPEDNFMDAEKQKRSSEDRKWRKRAWSSSIWGILCFYWGSGRTISMVDKTSGGLSFLADIFVFRDLWMQARA